MTRQSIIIAALVFAIIASVGGIMGCGDSSRSTCDCEICVNDQPAYPCDSEASCSQFATEQGCDSYTYTNSDTDTCGGAPQPVCRVTSCSGQCQCPGI